MSRPIYEIAKAIRSDWQNINFAAAPYLSAMAEIDNVRDDYMYDTGRSVVLYFLSNSSSWRGDTARKIKAELKTALKEA